MSGFTKLENDILEDLMKRRFNGTQYRILLAVLRYTFGFQRNNHEMSLKFIAEATGIDRSRVKKDLNKLIEDKVIKVVQEASFNSTRIIALNETLGEWETAYSVPIRPQGANSPTGNELDYSTGGETDYTPGGESDPQERKVKEIYKENDDHDRQQNLAYVSSLVPEKEYEKIFGHFPPPMLQQDIKQWIEESQFKEPESIICEMIYHCAKERPRHPDKYLRKAVDTLHNLGLFTLDAVKEYNAKFDSKAKNSKNGSVPSLSEMFEQPTEHKPLTEQELKELEEMEEALPF